MMTEIIPGRAASVSPVARNIRAGDLAGRQTVVLRRKLILTLGAISLMARRLHVYKDLDDDLISNRGCRSNSFRELTARTVFENSRGCPMDWQTNAPGSSSCQGPPVPETPGRRRVSVRQWRCKKEGLEKQERISGYSPLQEDLLFLFGATAVGLTRSGDERVEDCRSYNQRHITRKYTGANGPQHLLSRGVIVEHSVTRLRWRKSFSTMTEAAQKYLAKLRGTPEWSRSEISQGMRQACALPPFALSFRKIAGEVDRPSGRRISSVDQRAYKRPIRW